MNKTLLCAVLLFFTFLTSYGQCNVVKNGDFTGGIAGTWSYQTSTTGWYYEGTSFPNQAYTENDGVNGASLKQTLNGLLGNTLTLSFKVTGQNSSRSSTIDKTANLAIKLGGTTYITIYNTLNNTQIKTTDITVANGATYSQTGFPITVAGASQSALTSGVITLTIPWSSKPTSADLEFVQTTTGDDWALDDIALYSPLPTVYSVTGTNVCAGSSTTVGLSNSQAGVSYQLQLNGVNNGSALAGTGSAISFGSKSTTGSYTVIASNSGSTSCTATMSGNVVISPVIANNTISAAQSICTGTTPAALTATTPTGGNGTYIYLWESSTTSASTGFAAATGTNNISTYSPTSLSATTWYRRTVTSGGCSNTSSVIQITVNSASSVPTIGTITQPTCATATGSVILNGLPSGSWTLTRNPGNITTTGMGTNAAISGLSQGTYTYSVLATNIAAGLKGEYFINSTLSGVPAVTRTDATVNFDWVNGSPDPSIANDNFSVRWSGQIQPLYSETYTFTTSSDDGIRLWVNGTQIINNWTVHPLVDNTGTIALVAGVKYDIVLEYFEATAQAVSKLSWNSTSQAFQIIPSTQLFTSPSCNSLNSANVVINAQPVPAAAATIGTITQPTCATSTGSVILNGLPSGAWTLTRSPGNITTTGSGTSTTITGLPAGTYTYSMPAPNNTPGLKGEYFNNPSLSGIPTLTRTDATVNFDFGNGSPDPSINSDYITIRWSGQVLPLYSESYTFTTTSDDGIRLWVNGTQIINNWTDHGAVNDTGVITLTAGVKYDIVLEYFENAGAAVAKLGWSSASQAAEVIPQSQLFSATACNSLSTSNIVINAQPSVPTAPTVGTTTQPTCTTATGSVILNGLPSGSWTINPGGYTGSGTSYTVTGLAVGSYNFTVTNSSGCISVASALVSISSMVTTTWSGGSWNSGIPTLNKLAIIASNYDTTVNGNIDACSLTVNTGITLTIQNQTFVTIQNDLTVNNNAVVEIKNQGSLVMINNSGLVTTNGTGKFNVNKTTTAFEKYDYTYWSTPLSGSTTIATVFPTWRIDRAYAFHPENFIDQWNYATGANTPDGFDDDENDWLGASTMDTGRGYIIMGPTTGSFVNRTESVVFTGKVNTGVITTPIQLSPDVVATDDDFNLVGNPYPCAISADALIKANIYTGNAGTQGTINQTIDGTLYFWTHKADITWATNGLQSYNYSQDDYAIYTLAGGTGTTSSVSGGAKPLGYIASGQGFFVEGQATGLLTFNNSMRVSPSIVLLPVTPSTANSQFYKILPVKPPTVNRDRIWLNLENDLGMFSQQLVGYFDNTTLGYDKGYDGLLSDGGNYINFYSLIDDAAYKIQARPSFAKNDEVPLGYFSAIAGTFNVNIDSKEGVFENSDTDVFIVDKLTSIIHNLKESPYSFETESGTFNDRFVLRYTNKTLDNGDLELENNQVVVSVKNKQIKITSGIEMMDKILIFDIPGKLIYKKGNIDNNDTTIFNLTSSEQILLVKITLKNGKTVTRKIIY